MKCHLPMAVRADVLPARGFSLLEVMISLVIVAVGLLGVAKMQAAALSNTQIARTRSLIAMQADSLAGAMHANYSYWSTLQNALNVKVTGGANGPAISDGLGAAPDCTANVCTSQQMAAFDVQAWANTMNTHFPSYTANISCTAANTTATPVVPTVCTITVTWSEKYIAINQTTAAGNTAGTPQFTFFVEP